MHLIPSFRGRPTTELPAESGDSQIPPPSISPHESKHENVPAADRGKAQVPHLSSSLSFHLQPDQDSRTISYNTDLSASSSSTSSSTFNWEHDVFLSFRGEDTRHSFTDHLYYALNQRGIDTFRDTEKLRRGKSISPELLKAIEESKFAVIVISINYATSSWCLDELAHIAECMKLRGLEVLPVFYHVEPSEVRKQTGDFGKGFAKLKEYFNDNLKRVNKWREALQDIGCLSGWHVTKDRSEAEVNQEIATGISNILNNMSSDPDRDLIGMVTRIEKVKSYLDLRSNDVFTIGIWGMGGIGKTTLANEVFKKIRNQFDTSGFVSNVRLQSEEKALVKLQKLLCGSFFGDNNINIDTSRRGIRLLKKVLHKKKVLIVLDDVETFEQLIDLAPGRHDEENSWGPGSRLIITTRDRRTLTECGVLSNRIYEVEKLSDAEAKLLMCQKAFKNEYPPDEFVELLERFVKYASGLPLAHKVLGSYLSQRNVHEWSEALHRLDDDPDKEIFGVLQISFDGLKGTDKKIFLDIACFFNGEDHVRVKGILRSCGFSPEIGINELIDRSLIKIERKKLWMHDLLQQLGWHIVRRESPSPGNRSRLWVYDSPKSDEHIMSWRVQDARDVLMENMGTTAVEGLFFSLPEKEEMRVSSNHFSLMCNLRLLKISNVNFLPGGSTYLSKKLRFLEWHEFPLKTLSSFEPNQLVELRMPNSHVKRLWRGRLCLKMLIVMDLSYCQYLIETPDFSKVPKLERLILEGCEDLSNVHPTIWDHQLLVLLNLKGCTSLESLHPFLSLRALQTFILSGCSKLNKFPEIVGNMEILSELYLDGTAIRELPVSIQNLKGLILLNLSGCKNLLSLPSVLCSSLTSLKFLNMSVCSSLEKLPENIGCLKHLEELDVCNTAIRDVPESISALKSLKLLCFYGCYNSTGLELPDFFSGLRSLTTLNLGGCNLAEGQISDNIGNLTSLQSLDLSENDFLSIPESISQLSELKEISLFKCSKLQLLPRDHPSSLTNANLSYCPRLTNASYGWRRLASQKGLSIRNCRNPVEFSFENLVELDLSNCHHLTKIPDLNKVPNLRKLILEGCESLSEVHPTIGCLQHLVVLNLKGCVNLKSLPHSIRLKSLRVFILSGCSKLSVFPEIEGDMINLIRLHLDRTALRDLPLSIQNLKGLCLLNLSGCKNLYTISNLPSMKHLYLSGSSCISALPVNLWSFAHLQEIDASETAIKILHWSLSHLKNLKVLSFCGCEGLQLPDWFSDLKSLTSLNLSRCGLSDEVLDHLCCLYSLQRLDLSENNFVRIPESISQLSKLTELRLCRCSKLRVLPKNLPFNLKYVHARECPMLKNIADTLTIWNSGKGFRFMNCGQSGQDDDQPSHVQVSVPENSLELLFPKYIEDRINGRKPFEIRFQYSTRNSRLWSRWSTGPPVDIPPSDGNSTWIGISLSVKFEILQKDSFDNSWEAEETVCEFRTHAGYKKCLFFQNFLNFSAGSYGLHCYEPREGQFGALLDNASQPLQVSVSTKRPDLKVRGCRMCLISQENAANFVQYFGQFLSSFCGNPAI